MKFNAWSIIVFLVVCSFYTSHVSCFGFHLTRKMTVKILNGLPNNDHLLQFRCQDGDSDKGMQTLRVGEEYHWKFHNNLFGKTLWFCHFYWGNKDRSFEVYNDNKMFPLCLDHTSPHGKTCYWMVKENGFYGSTREQDINAKDREHKGIKLLGWDHNDGPVYLPPPPPPPSND